MKTNAEKLAQVETAIEKAEQLQAYQTNGLAATRPNLDVLYRERTRLEKLISAEDAAACGRVPGRKNIGFEDP